MQGLDSRWKLFLGSIILCSFIVIPYLYGTYQTKPYNEPFIREWSSQLPMHLNLEHLTEKGTKEKMIALAKLIYNAKKHVRGSKTSDLLKKAVSVMNTILKDIDVDTTGLYARRSVKSKHICEENYKGGEYGYPMYYEGFVTNKCPYGVPVSKLVTVIKYVAIPSNANILLHELEGFITSINSVIKNANFLIAINTVSLSNDIEKKHPGVKLKFTRFQSEGSALNSIMKEVKTPYVLVARKMNIFTNDSRLERLVREIESINVTAVDGAFRDQNGHWRKGCYQSVYRNYSLEYIEGYDESFHECLFCDYIQGPFITTAKYLKQNKFKNIDENNGLFEDWFLKISQSGQESIVCPDSMFHVKNLTLTSTPNWKEFSEYWNVFKVVTPKGEEIKTSCEKAKISSKPSKALSPCAMKLYNDGINLIMRTCEKTGAICQLQEGSVLGAIKLGKNLPWDLDYDLRFSLTNCSNCKLLYKALNSAGLKIGNFAPSCCKKLSKPTNFPIYYKGKYGDFTGHPIMDSEILIKDGIAPTKVLFDGQWVNVPRNPGMFVRNRYGREIYRHAEHWRYTGHKYHRPNYTTNVFIKCKEPGGPNCLDRYNADGDLPFKLILP